MPIIKSAIKRVKQATKRHDRNVAVKKDIKTALKAFTAKPTAETFSKVQSEIDTAVKKNLLPKNTAARRKASLAKIAKEAGVKLTAKKATAVKKPAAAKATTTAKKPAAKAAPKAAAKTTATKKPAATKVTAVKKPAVKKTAAKKPAAKKTTK